MVLTRSRISFTFQVRPSVLLMPRMFGIAVAGAQQGGELAVAVEAFVVHLHHEDVVEAGEDVFQPVRQRIDMADVQRGNAVAGGAGAVHGFADRAFGRTPADEQDVAFAAGRKFSAAGRVAASACSFLRRLAVICMCSFGEPVGMAQFVVLQAGGDRIFAARESACRARRAARRRPARTRS